MSDAHIARVHYNPSKGGVRWWGEDDLGFTGGAERLAELIEMITEWAEAEGVLERLSIRLVRPAASPPAPLPNFTAPERFLGPYSVGADTTQVGFEVTV